MLCWNVYDWHAGGCVKRMPLIDAAEVYWLYLEPPGDWPDIEVNVYRCVRRDDSDEVYKILLQHMGVRCRIVQVAVKGGGGLVVTDSVYKADDGPACYQALTDRALALCLQVVGKVRNRPGFADQLPNDPFLIPITPEEVSSYVV